VREIYLGPDPDREGEAIAWHIAEALGPGEHRYHRVLFMELTREAIRQALAQPGELHRPRYDSQQARRVLDRLVGYQISPLLWDKVKRGLSAGRVQSVALRLVCERERAIAAFVPEEYWSLSACLKGAEPPRFTAELVKHRGKSLKLASAEQVEEIMEALAGAEFRVAKVEEKPRQRHPAAPFITSSLQMEASRKLRLSPAQTMRLAQRLYEGIDLGPEGPVGLITYMRTDSTRVAAEALSAVRAFIGETFGQEYLPKSPHKYKSPRGAQEAHEAIRPTSVLRRPQDIKAYLKKDELALYDLIWRRFVASQMASAVYHLTSVDINAGDYLFRSTASVLHFPGFMSLYQESAEEEGNGDRTGKLPPLKAGDLLELVDFEPQRHFTKPPPRFTEASLIKELEEQGIGRPSTYATILSNLQDRLYVLKLKTYLRPTELGLVVNDLLVENFPRVMDPQFTAHLEEDLDRIAEGEIPWQEVMRRFYGPFSQALEEARGHMRRVRSLPTGLQCPRCQGEVVIRWGRNGEFLGCAAYPECSFTQDLRRDSQGNIILTGFTSEARSGEAPEAVSGGQAALKASGTGLSCPQCGKELVVRRGKLGEFLGCTGYPKCKFTRNFRRDAQGGIVPLDKVAGESEFPCAAADCDGSLAQKRSRRGVFFGCSRYPACSYTLNQPPVAKACPQCGFPWLRPKGKKWVCPREGCGYQEAVASEPIPPH